MLHKKALLAILLAMAMLCAIPSFSYAVEDPEPIDRDPQIGTAMGVEEEADESAEMPMFMSLFSFAPASIQTRSPYIDASYTHRNDFSGNDLAYGIDVSRWNGAIDWAQVKASGVDYVFVRVAFRYTESGNLEADGNYAANLAGAHNAGLKVGAYIYSQAITPAEGVQEALYMMELVRGYTIDMPLVLDYEYAANNTGRLYNANLSVDAATAVCTAFADAIKAGGYTPMVYANKMMLSQKLDAETISKSCGIWLAQYNDSVTYLGPYSVWQYTSSGSVPGVGGRVDCNFFYFDREAPVSGNISGFSLGTTVAGFLSAQKLGLGQYGCIVDHAGDVKDNESIVATGDVNTIIDITGDAVAEQTIVIYGDVNGNGVVDLFDLLDMRQKICGTKSLSGEYSEAADINRDDTIDLVDILDMHQHICGTKLITQ